MQKIEKDLTSLIESFQRSAVFREGLSAVIVGRPNVGKSSFFNALLARDRALVSEFPGTTRDVIEESISIAGIPIRLTDTAGLSPGMNHPIDVMSMEKTKKAISNADFYIFLLDGSSPLQEEDNLAYQEIEKIKGSFPSRKVVVLITKSDLEQKLQTKVAPCFSEGRPPIEISSKTLQGFETLEKRLEDFITANCIEPEIETITRLRHLRALEQGREALCAAKRAFLEKKSLEFVIADLKRALDSMRELIGEIYSEDLLDVIFSEFCIGK